LAIELPQRGLRGSFQSVAELTRHLQKHGRQDVISAMVRHEIGYHSNYHCQRFRRWSRILERMAFW